MQIQQPQYEFDLYYQGSQQQLLSLIYPLSSVDSPIFQHLELQEATYAKHQKSLEFKYRLGESLTNIEEPQPQSPSSSVVYKSKHIANRCNYFFSTVLPKEGCMVWRSVSGFLQMRPGKEAKEGKEGKEGKEKEKVGKEKLIDKELEEIMMQRDGGRILQRRMKSYQYVRQMQKSEPRVKLTVISETDPANYPLRNIRQAPNMPLKHTKGYSKQEYLRSLSVL